MLYVTIDPSLDDVARNDRFVEVSRELHRAARKRVEDGLDGDLELARRNGVVADGVARLVRTRGNGRLTVDPELYSQLSSDEGLVVTGWDADEDLDGPAPADLPVQRAAFSEATDDGDGEAAKAPAKKSSTAKKAPAKKAAASKSSTTTKKAAAKRSSRKS